jgi:hypothetical protein
MHFDCTQSSQILAPSSPRHPCAGTVLPTPGHGAGIPSACEALAARLEFASVVDVTPEVRAALAQLGEWLQTGDYGTREIAAWLVGARRDVQQPPRWGLSLLDRSAHAVDVDANHPPGAYIARSGHTLPRGTLHAELGDWRTCPTCARWTAR